MQDHPRNRRHGQFHCATGKYAHGRSKRMRGRTQGGRRSLTLVEPLKVGRNRPRPHDRYPSFSVNHPTEADAIRAADRACKGQGIIDCRMMVTFANGCGAVVTSPLSIVAGFPIVGFGKGSTPGEAYADASRNLPTGTGSVGSFNRQHACTQP
ncbi:DUF4189 domain-containing protein [Nocardia brasiliensis]